jgi:hypothetical protein
MIYKATADLIMYKLADGANWTSCCSTKHWLLDNLQQRHSGVQFFIIVFVCTAVVVMLLCLVISTGTL